MPDREPPTAWFTPPAVIAVDLTETQCHGVVATLTGEVLRQDSQEIPPATDPSLALLHCLERLRARMVAAQVPLRAVVVGVSPEAYSDARRSAELHDVLAEHVHEPLLVDANVNLRAMGHAGGDGGTSVTLAIGTRVAAAAVADGRLLEGWTVPAELERVAALTAPAGGHGIAQHVLDEVLDHTADALAAIVDALQPAQVILDGAGGRALAPHLGVLQSRVASAVQAVPELRVSPPETRALVDGAIVAAIELARGDHEPPGPPAVVDATQALDLLRTVVRIPSVTGDELFLAGVVAGELHALGFDEVALDEHVPGRGGVSGVLRGTADGQGLLLFGHLATGSSEGWGERWRGHEQEEPYSAVVIDGELWGRGAADAKAGVAAALAAVHALRRAGARLRGDVTLALAAGEDGAGTETLLARLRSGGEPRPTFAIALAPTALAVRPSHPAGGRPFDVPQAARLRAAVRSVRPECGDTHGAPLWSALPFVPDVGIPAASFGPGDPELSDTLDERIALHDYLDSVRALAIFIAEHCGLSA